MDFPPFLCLPFSLMIKLSLSLQCQCLSASLSLSLSGGERGVIEGSPRVYSTGQQIGYLAAPHRLIDEGWIPDDGCPGRSLCRRAEARGFIRFSGIRSLPLRDGLLCTQDPVTSALRPGEPRCETRNSPPQLHPEGGSDQGPAGAVRGSAGK